VTTEPDVYYIFKPADPLRPPPDVEFLSVREFLADEPACHLLWELLDTQFRTRSKFLAIWPCVSFVCVHRDTDGALDGCLLVSAPVNWQIDYVVVRPDSRGQGIASKLVKAALAHATVHKPPYVMLTSKESLRPLYEGCGFRAIPNPAAVPV
jgi:GNAT superfamily N-acetyltransferase